MNAASHCPPDLKSLLRCSLRGLALGLALISASAGAIQLDDAEIRRLGINVQPAEPARVLRLLDQPGNVRVPNAGMLIITAPAAGVLTRMAVAEGQTVTPGDLLAELAGPDVAALEADYRTALLADHIAQIALERTTGLVADGALALRAREQAELDRSRAADTLRGVRAALTAAGVDDQRMAELDDGAAPRTMLSLRARKAGTVLRQFAAPGERLTLGTPLLEVGQLETLWVETHVGIERVRGFRPGDSARIDAGPGRRLTGQIVTIGRRVHEADRGLLVRVEVADPQAMLIPGQSVQVALERQAPSDAVSVPQGALLMLSHQATVFSAQAGRFTAVPVTVVAHNDGRLIVSGALQPGDAVVIEGTSALRALLDAETP